MSRSLALLGLLLLAACSNDEGGGARGISSGPLAGTFRGTPFTAKRAYARRQSPSAKTLLIVEADVGCAESSKQKRGITVIVTWQTGYTREFSREGTTVTNAVLYFDENGVPKNEIITEGKLELVESSPEKMSTGRLRLVVLGSDTTIEGEVPLEVCD